MNCATSSICHVPQSHGKVWSRIGPVLMLTMLARGSTGTPQQQLGSWRLFMGDSKWKHIFTIFNIWVSPGNPRFRKANYLVRFWFYNFWCFGHFLDSLSLVKVHKNAFKPILKITWDPPKLAHKLINIHWFRVNSFSFLKHHIVMWYLMLGLLSKHWFQKSWTDHSGRSGITKEQSLSYLSKHSINFVILVTWWCR